MKVKHGEGYRDREKRKKRGENLRKKTFSGPIFRNFITFSGTVSDSPGTSSLFHALLCPFGYFSGTFFIFQELFLFFVNFFTF